MSYTITRLDTGSSTGTAAGPATVRMFLITPRQSRRTSALIWLLSRLDRLVWG